MKENLDLYQTEVMTYEDDLLVIAGPGSGKTTTIMHKVNYLKDKYPDKKILLISFTNKSVEDLKKKITIDCTITTFHKLAIDILDYHHLPYEIVPTGLLDYIIDEYLITLNTKEKDHLCRYLNIIKFNKFSDEYIAFKNLIKTFINLYKTNNHNYDTINTIVQEYNDRFLLKIIFKILVIYEEEKKSQNFYDFDDLIVEATKTLKKYKSYKRFDYLIVDEFQDTSLIRLNLIKEIFHLNNASITAVGDDAQSIFHFSGCDLNIFLGFQNYFPKAKIVHLKNTYRNSQELINISEYFINKNPSQIKKKMHGFISRPHPIKLLYYFDAKNSLKKALDQINSDDILILGRNKKDIKKYLNKDITYENDIVTYKNKTYRFMTIHSSKGLEAEYVIILNNEDSSLGLPNKIEDHPIINYLNGETDTYPYAEERRVFFVGITRCKKETILLVPRSNPSSFIKEIKKVL